MTLYTRKNGEFVELTREQVRRLRRNDEVIRLQKAASVGAANLNMLADWLHNIRGRHIGVRELHIMAPPNCTRLKNISQEIIRAIGTLRSV